MNTRVQDLIALLDLTLLDDAHASDIDSFLDGAVTPHGNVAAVVVWPEYVSRAAAAVASHGIRVATVAGFPDGPCDADRVAAQCAEAIQDGADEVDIVFAYRAWQAGDHVGPVEVVQACRTALGDHTLKVILETAAFDDPVVLRAACDAVLDAGADFLKTSTGKGPGGATPAAAAVLIQAIANQSRVVGFKASGGVRRFQDCLPYVDLFEQSLGAPDSSRLRFGASGLLGDLLEHVRGTP